MAEGADVMGGAISTVGDTGAISGPAPGGGISPLSVGALGAGAIGIGAMLSGKPGLPWQYGALENRVPGLWQQSGQLYSSGYDLISQGKEGLAMAQRGELTPEQAAALKLQETSLMNTARQ